MRSAVVGLVTMMAGCLLIRAGLDPRCIRAVFVRSVRAGGASPPVQVVANPLISMLGAPATASSRLTFAQAFNSSVRRYSPMWIRPHFGLACDHRPQDALRRCARCLSCDRDPGGGRHLSRARRGDHGTCALRLGTPQGAGGDSCRTGAGAAFFRPADAPPLRLGALCIFLYVGAEVAIGSLIVNYLMQASVLGISAEQAGKHVPLYWGGAMVGRFIGAVLIAHHRARESPRRRRNHCDRADRDFLQYRRRGSGYSLLAIGLCNSIMFPTSLHSREQGLGKRRRRVPASSAWPSSAGGRADRSRERPPISRT